MSQSVIVLHPAQRLADLTLRTLHASLLGIGLVVSLTICASLLTGELPISARQFIESLVSDSDQDAAPTVVSPVAIENPLAGNLQAVADGIARRYRVARPAVEDIVRTAEITALGARLDPLLVLAVIGVESRFNPYSESPFGAQGLMQIIGRFHTDKFSPTPDGAALLDPETNIRVGVKILREYLQRTGDLDAALKLYGGESETSGFGYAERVFAERERLLQSTLRSRKN